ncbi:MAG: hypothetical protein EOO39_28540 [Cytophagaceae bacterium]|nr:MAG: hypothetical protein EOO39_28540 [Cytophagaceae bacterium]
MVQPKKPLGAVLAALFPKSEKAISEALGQEAFNEFAAEAQETQNQLDAQAQGNQAVADDLTSTQATLKETQDKLTASETALEKTNNDLTAANKTNGELKAKADQWDAYQASLKGAQLADDSTNTPKGGKVAASGLTAKEQAQLEDKQRLAAKFPGLTADLGITPAAE